MEDQGLQAIAKTGKSNQFLTQFASRGLELIPPDMSQAEVPTSRPRQQDRRGRLIDSIAGARVTSRKTSVHVGSHKVLGTDHELLSTELLFGGLRSRRRPDTKPRVVAKEIPPILDVNQQEMTRLAREHTKVKGGRGYRDPPSVKALFDMARFSREAEDWKKAFAERRKEKRNHHERQVQEVAQGDWSGFRGLKKKRAGDWECHFAECQDGDPHKSIHDHLEGIYGDTPPDLTDFEPEGCFEPIRPEELHEAVRQGKRGKSVGEDGTSLELIEGILVAEGGESAILNWFSDILESGCMPDDWFTALMIILPKVAQPEKPKQLRKQSTDYIHAVQKLFGLEREWKFGLCFLKVDLEKAFDCVSKESLMAYIKSKIGRSFEARCWQKLLRTSEAHLHTAWGDSTLQLHHGIRQGAVESPLFFTNLAEWTLEETARRFSWPREDPLLRGLRITELMFVDDATLWQTSLPDLARRVEQWMTVLRESGLRINLGKCQLYCSPRNRQGGKLVVSGTELVSDNHLNIMGLRFVVNQTTCEVISTLLTRARDKFWGSFHLLGSRALNSFQLQLVVFMMDLKRGQGEALWRGGHKRWSTLWAERFWMNGAWWKAEQQNPYGERHTGKFYARFTLEEAEMDAVAGKVKCTLKDTELPSAHEPRDVGDDATFEIELLFRQLVQVQEQDIAGEMAWRLRQRLERPREDELEDRPRGGVDIPMEWNDTVSMLEAGVVEAAKARVRTTSPGPDSPEQDDVSSLVATWDDTSRLHQEPATTDEAIDAWLDIFGFVEPPTDSLPTVLPERLQEDIRRMIQGMSGRAIGLLRRSLPLCLNAVQDEVLELLRTDPSSSSREGAGCAGVGRHENRGSRSSGAALPEEDRPRARGRERPIVRSHPGAGGHEGRSTSSRPPGTETADNDMVEVTVDDSDHDSDSTLRMQLSTSSPATNTMGRVSSRLERDCLEAKSGHEEGPKGGPKDHSDEESLVQTTRHSDSSSSSPPSASSESKASSIDTSSSQDPDESQQVWNKHRGGEPGPRHSQERGRDEHVARQTWWMDSVNDLVRGGPGDRISRSVWESTAGTIRAREDAEYAKFAEVLLSLLGGHLDFQGRGMEQRLWHMYETGDFGETGPKSRKRPWRANNKPSWELPHPMGLMAAQMVTGDRYWCRCVRLESGEIVAVRDEANTDETRPAEMPGAGDEDKEDEALMQTSLTKLLGHQSRTRVVLQGLNFRLSNLGGGDATRRAKALLVRLARHFRIEQDNRGAQPELVQDAEAILAGHIDPELTQDFGNSEDYAFVEGWWTDLVGALNRDIHMAPLQTIQCLSEKEVQEIEHDQESQEEQNMAQEEWEEHMRRKKMEEEEVEHTPQVSSAREYQQWEDWAMWDEMQTKPTRKRRLQVEIRCGSSSSSSRAMVSCPVGEWDGMSELNIRLRLSPGEDGSEVANEADKPKTVADSEASTLLVEGMDDGAARPPALQSMGPQAWQEGASIPPTTLDGSTGSSMMAATSGASLGTTLSWGGAGTAVEDTLDPVTLAEIDAYAEQLRLEYREQARRGDGDEAAGFEEFLVTKAEGFLGDGGGGGGEPGHDDDRAKMRGDYE
ncbi:Ank3 [Symbiodinium necroappetens]|uniref:Ank3 protein n=1 Tax=Symbiodinium necroappetens TaxID=1628268 RepID=A0A812Q8T3_9DINO|nr:Ank3 [Symbiodinium necroappetens]